MNAIVEIHQQIPWPYRRLCAALAVPYPNFQRWKSRLTAGVEPILAPGPKKVIPPDPVELRWWTEHLQPRRHRTLGTGAMIRALSPCLSRRNVQRLVRLLCQEVHRRKGEQMRRVEWLMAGAIWAMDDTELTELWREVRERIFLNQVRDLASRYTFVPLVGALVHGPVLADRLRDLFEQHGPPLVCKRDLGSNLQHEDVDTVLAQYLVIPLDSPPHYPPYNGGIEHANGETKTDLLERIGQIDRRNLIVWAELTTHDRNHKSRRCLHGRTPCEALRAGQNHLRGYDRRKRRDAWDWIDELTIRLIDETEEKTKCHAAAARRLAVETWLEHIGAITVLRPQNVSPVFPGFRYRK